MLAAIYHAAQGSNIYNAVLTISKAASASGKST